jgi:UDP-N-acetyl-D-glucosamine dehydrogenase
VAVAGVRYKSSPLIPETVASMDAVILLTGHRDVSYDMVLANAPLVLDTQNKLRNKSAANVVPL